MKYQHALCLYPYLSDHTSSVGVFPPTGLEYIATALTEHVPRVSLIDLRHERDLQPMENLHRFITRENVDLIGVSLSWKAKYRKALEYVARLPGDQMIVAGGREATENVEEVFQACPNVSAIVRGEGERTIAEFAAGKPWDQILGLSYRNGDRTVHNPNRPLEPVEHIRPPDRSLRRTRYVPVLRARPLMNLEFDTILSSRGCPYHCKFCTFNLNPLGQKRQYEARSPESVVDEIASTSARIIQFADDNFFVKPARAQRICDLLIDRKIDKIYCANARLEISRNPEMLEKAYRAGFRVLLLGVESASDRILAQLDKGFTTDQVREAFAVLRKFPFWYHAYFIYGNVGETEREMLAIADFARELGVHAIGLSQLRIDKFTPLRQLVESTPGYWITPNGHVYCREFDKTRLRKIRNRIRNRFWYRPGQVLRMLAALHRTRILTGRHLLQLGIVLPRIGLDYLAQRLAKKISRRQGR